MDYLKYMDIFTIRFHLYTHNQPKYRNEFGGIMSVIYFLICIGIFVGLSYDDLNKLNPISSKSEICDTEPRTVNLNKEKIWIPFRMVTYGEKFIDHREFLYILPYFVEGKYNKEEGMDLKYNLLQYKFCNETSMANKTKNYKIDIKLNELFCIDKEDIPFGGSWNGDYINYIEINLHLCKDGIDFNSSDPRCSNMKDLLKNRNTSLIFEFFYPIVQFQPTNVEIPITIIYRSYYYRLSTYSNKVERLYLQEHILADDRSQIISNYKNSSSWGMSDLYGDDYFLPEENDIENISSRIYSLDIYMDEGYIYYTRSYKKIFLIIANTMPIIRIVLYFINKFTQHIKMSYVKRNLAGLIFENKPKSKNAFIKLKNKNNNYSQSINRIKLAKLNNNQEIKNNISDNKSINQINRNIKILDYKKKINEYKIKDNINNNNNSVNKSNISLNSDNAIKILNKKDILLINSKNNKSLSLEGSLKQEVNPIKIKNYPNQMNKKYIFSYYYFCLDLFFDKIVNPQKFCFISKNYFTVYNFMCQIYDISNYIILFKQINILNYIIKKLYEKKGLNFSKRYKKININDNDIINKVNSELNSDKSILFSHYL